MNLADAFAAELDALISPGSAFRVGRAAYSRPELAQRISGAPRGSKAYKAALRNLERYEASTGKQQRKPSERAKEQLAETLRRDDKAIDTAATHGVKVDIIGEFHISKEKRKRHVSFTMNREELALALRQVSAGQNAAAFETVFTAYGFVPDAVLNQSVKIE